MIPSVIPYEEEEGILIEVAAAGYGQHGIPIIDDELMEQMEKVLSDSK